MKTISSSMRLIDAEESARHLTREQRREALAAYRACADEDAWGNTMVHWHSIADVAHHTIGTPIGWKYRHGASDALCWGKHLAAYVHTPKLHAEECVTGHSDCPWEGSDVITSWYMPYAEAPELLIYAGNVLARYARRLERAGLDY